MAPKAILGVGVTQVCVLLPIARKMRNSTFWGTVKRELCYSGDGIFLSIPVDETFGHHLKHFLVND